MVIERNMSGIFLWVWEDAPFLSSVILSNILNKHRMPTNLVVTISRLRQYYHSDNYILSIIMTAIMEVSYIVCMKSTILLSLYNSQFSKVNSRNIEIKVSLPRRYFYHHSDRNFGGRLYTRLPSL